jgi:hypothetical protein
MTQTFAMPYSGLLLVTHLASYGLAAALDAKGVEAFVGHDPDALELTPQVKTSASLAEICTCIRESALECKPAVEADVEPGRTGNDRIPVIRARATDPERAITSLTKRERLLDDLEACEGCLPVALIAGLGAPAPWLHDGARSVPQRGASELDGVAVNYPADIVRSALRHALPAGEHATEEDISRLRDSAAASPEIEDKLGWTPPGTSVEWLHQWLAALGLCLLPVGLRAGARARTPGFWRGPASRGVTLPVLAHPVSVARLRAILQLPVLSTNSIPQAAAPRLRALGISELVSFSVLDRSTPQMVQFSFSRGTRLAI